MNFRPCLLTRLWNFIPNSLKINLYKSLIDPHIGYCDCITDGCSLTSKRKLQVAQNNLLRAIVWVGGTYSTEALHTELGIDWVDVTSKKSLCIEIFTCINNLTPTSNCDKIQFLDHGRNTRTKRQKCLQVPKTWTLLEDQNIFARVPHAWDTLPLDINELLLNVASKQPLGSMRGLFIQDEYG